ncbi:substrate-binding domain-containing protein [Paracoccus lutimaris]|uniref:Monosaccharide ABC transporter substrate-binding protein (CUT2 family) n=1 Tax=Paracoccus lutimaris TaxID=1490030 RepID=A0A368Z8J2_9RHOB|nr:substrate-binding domain-containing protein [Paracoccus lutimaris]RCW86774.1 monosaccharide ABC transporter substrate-binding protein (CUT2 family) [Paracoccus lutimaris]
MMNMRKNMLAAMLASVALTGAASAADIAVIAGSANDAFFNRVKKGVDDAALVVQANGGTVNYLTTQNYDNFGPDLVQLINTAVSQGVDGIAIPVWVAESQVPALKSAADQGIKIMMYNSGAEVKEQIAGINYFGSDEFVAGEAGGAYMAKKGAKKILCHIHVPGAVNLERRCDGIVAGAEANGATVMRLPTPASIDSDVTGTSEALKAELLKDPSIDAVITMGAWASDAATIAIQQAGRPVLLGTFDLSPSVLERIKAGTQTMAIDQQPYAQAFLATTMLAAYIDFGIDLPTDPVLTGPGIVDAGNIDAALVGVAAGAR